MGGTGVEPGDGLLIRASAAYDGVVGDPAAFGSLAAEVAALARRAGDVEALVVALRAVAWFERSRLRHRKARILLDEAVREAQRAGLDGRLAEVLTTRAAVRLEQGQIAGAERDLDLAEGIDKDAVPAELLFMRAVHLHNLGQLAEAADAYDRLRGHPGASADNLGSAANNLALIASVRGRFAESLRHLDEASEIAAEVGPSLHAFVAHNRGLVLAQSGQLVESLREFDRATELFTAEDLPLGEHFIEHADVLVELRLLPEALALARRAAAELESNGVALMAAEARLTVAESALMAGDAATAQDTAERALAQFRRQRRAAWAARATVVGAEAGLLGGGSSAALLARVRRAAAVLDRLGMSAVAARAHLVSGRIAEELGRYPVATDAYGAARERCARGPVLVRVRGRVAAARAERVAGHGAAVLLHCRVGLADLDRHRAALGSTELRALASGHGVELGRLGTEVLLGSGSAARLFGWMERTRAAALLTVEPPAPESLRSELDGLAVVHGEVAQAVRESGGPPADLLARQAAAENRLRRAAWRRSGTRSGPGAGTVAPAELRELLGRSALVSYAAHGDRIVAVLLGRAGARVVRLGAAADVRFENDALLFALRRLTRPGPPARIGAARASAEHSLQRLRELLVEPLGLTAECPLVVVPAAVTNRVPWSAMHPGPVSVAPSATLWARARRAPVPTGGETVLVAGPGLPGAVDEVAAVARQHAGCTVLAPPEATVAAALDALGRAQLAHLACHGLLRADNPTFSALDLVDGRLTVHDLDLRGIAPHRVVLAACDSAADVSYDGDELVGFVSALLSRGTAGLVASVVAVGDVEAVELMTALHAGLAAGAPVAEALHAARACVDLSVPRAFVNWCAFTAYGAG